MSDFDSAACLDSTHHQTGRGENFEHEATYCPNIPEQIDHAAGHFTEQEIAEAPYRDAFREVSDTLAVLVAWFATSKNVHSAGLRAFALVTILHPEVLEVHTQKDLARKVGVTRQGLSKYVAELAKLGNGLFRRSEWCRGSEARQSYRARALAVHARTRSKERP